LNFSEEAAKLKADGINIIIALGKIFPRFIFNDSFNFRQVYDIQFVADTYFFLTFSFVFSFYMQHYQVIPVLKEISRLHHFVPILTC
jgi:hypothetical protein